MQLLEPSEIILEKKKIVVFAQERNQKLAQEESRLVLAVNIAREKAEREIKEIDLRLKSHKEKTEWEKSILNQEVVNIEEKRKELLKHIEGIKKSAEIILSQAQEREKEAEQEKIMFIQKTNDLQNDFKIIEQRKKLLEHSESEFNEREQELNKKETRAKEANDKLFGKNGELEKLYQAIKINEQKTEKLTERENQLNTQELAIEIRQKEQDKIDQELQNERRALQSGYEALEQAKKHLKI